MNDNSELKFSKSDIENKKETDDVIFTRFLNQNASTGNHELDELRTEYIALQAFNEVAPLGLQDAMQEEKMRAQIMEKLHKKKAA